VRRPQLAQPGRATPELVGPLPLPVVSRARGTTAVNARAQKVPFTNTQRLKATFTASYKVLLTEISTSLAFE